MTTGKNLKQLILIVGVFILVFSPILALRADENGEWVQLTLTGYDVTNEYSHPILLKYQSDSTYDLFSGRESGTILYQQNLGLNATLFDLAMEESGVFLEEWDHSAPAPFDYNNDLQIDLILGDASGKLHLYERNGSSITLNDTFVQNLNVTGFAKPTAADLNADGLIDLIVGDMDGHISAFINQGTAGIPNWVLTPQVFQGIRVGDFASPVAIFPRGIGDVPDLVIGTSNDGITYLRNTGTEEGEEFPRWEEIGIRDSNNPFNNIPGLSNEKRLTPFLIDLEGDDNRFLDLIIGNASGAVKIYKNKGVDLSNINKSPEFPIFEILAVFGLIVIPLTIVTTLLVRGWIFKGKPIYLLLLHSSGISPYSFSFTGEKLEINTLLAGGAFVGIQSLLAEITKSPDLKSLDAGKSKILISKLPFTNIGGELEILLWATAEDKKLRKACYELGKYVVNTYQKQFKDSYFDESFTSTLNLAVARFFSLSGEISSQELE